MVLYYPKIQKDKVK